MTEREERSKIAKETEREERNRIVKEMVEMVVKRTSPDYARGYRDGYAAAKRGNSGTYDSLVERRQQ